MKIYQLKPLQQKAFIPDWHFDPATIGQLKVLSFFGIDISKSLTKGVCSGIIGRLFSNPENKHLWNAYVYTTGDEDRTSSILFPHDKAALAQVKIPDDWKPKRSSNIPGKTYKVLEELVVEVLKDGSPFDDPLPEITIQGTAFCFTSKFQFGTRKECEAAIISRGGTTTKDITSKTNVLVVGNHPNPNWSHGSYGNKIINAMILKLHHHKPLIIPELYWSALLNEADDPN
ncbi:MAG: BRCT domain-containing protein [Methylacidiphilales bacterium]|nr:BRCT domain-containing protein [Candidatus Methylacidiphilales bacterium]